MLTFPALEDRLLVLVAGLVMALGLGYILNRIRMRTEAEKSKEEVRDS